MRIFDCGNSDIDYGSKALQAITKVAGEPNVFV